MCEKYLRVCVPNVEPQLMYLDRGETKVLSVPNVPIAEEPQQGGATAAND